MTLDHEGFVERERSEEATIRQLSAGPSTLQGYMLARICIFLPTGGAIRGKGEVRWVRNYHEGNDLPPGMGIRFVELEPGCLELIETFLAHREHLFFDDE